LIKMLPNLKLTSTTFILAIICLLFIPTFELVLADSNAIEVAPGQPVGGELTLSISEPAPEISVLAPESISGWTLDPQQTVNLKQEIIVINATGPWGVYVYPDSITAGYMTEYDSASAQFVQDGIKLRIPLMITSQDGNTVDLSVGGLLVTGQGDAVVPVTFEQKVGWDDPALPEGHTHQIGLTFSGSPM